MPKAYWLSAYRAIHNPDAMAAYAAKAGPAITAAGGRFIVRGMAAAAKEQGIAQRTVIVEFPDLATALATYDSPAYQDAIEHLKGGAVERDLRIVEGL